jgi:hypothetical protein
VVVCDNTNNGKNIGDGIYLNLSEYEKGTSGRLRQHCAFICKEFIENVERIT